MQAQTSAIDARQFRRAMGKFATGVTVITFRHDGASAGMTANAFMSLSVDPPMVLVSARRQARFCHAVKPGDLFGISFLLEAQEGLSRHFGGKPVVDLPSPFSFVDEVPLISGALVRLVVRAAEVHAGGDHFIYTAVVEALQEDDGRPLLFFGGKYKQMHALDPAQCWIDGGL